MEPYISLITLGVSDLVRSTAFCKQGLVLPAKEEFEGVTFLNLRGIWLALYLREALAADAHISAAGNGFRRFLENKLPVGAGFSRSLVVVALSLAKPAPTNGYLLS